MATGEYQDYFSPKEVRYTYTFPDGKSSISFRKLTEGDRVVLQNIKSEVEYDKKTEKMKMDLASGEIRQATITRAAIEWDLMRRNDKGEMERVPFEPKNVKALIDGLDPTIIDAVYELIIENNKWLAPKKDEEKEKGK